MLTRIQACFLALTISAVAADSRDQPQIERPARVLQDIMQQVEKVKLNHPVAYLTMEENLKNSFLNHISNQLGVQLSIGKSESFKEIATAAFSRLCDRWMQQTTKTFEDYKVNLPSLIEEVLEKGTSQPGTTINAVPTTQDSASANFPAEVKVEDASVCEKMSLNEEEKEAQKIKEITEKAVNDALKGLNSSFGPRSILKTGLDNLLKK